MRAKLHAKCTSKLTYRQTQSKANSKKTQVGAAVEVEAELGKICQFRIISVAAKKFLIG